MAATCLDHWQQRQSQPWLLGVDPKIFKAQVNTYRQLFALKQTALEQLNRDLSSRELRDAVPQSPLILIADPDPVTFLASFIAACLEHQDIALANPTWGHQEWQQVFVQVTPTHIIGPTANARTLASFQNSEFRIRNSEFRILIPTGGTSGHIRFAVHTWQTLSAAVMGFCDYFGCSTVHAYCVLPLYHVSGLMQALRTWISGGQLVVQTFKSLLAGERLITPGPGWFISLVPTQLQRLFTPANPQKPSLQSGPWLTQFQAVLLGGAPAWSQLLDQAQAQDIPVALTYGMTETAAQIATLKPADFLQGNRSNGRILPHVQVTIERTHEIDPYNKSVPATISSGPIKLQSSSLMLGYWGESFKEREKRLRDFFTDDIGYLDSEGYLYVLGRNSDKIITGGENVFPIEVEAALLATQKVLDVCVIGLPDMDWGQVVAVLYVPIKATITVDEIKGHLEGQLSRYKYPKIWQSVTSLPRNAQGKLNRQAVMAQLTTGSSNAVVPPIGDDVGE